MIDVYAGGSANGFLHSIHGAAAVILGILPEGTKKDRIFPMRITWFLAMTPRATMP